MPLLLNRVNARGYHGITRSDTFDVGLDRASMAS
jgi:hypothetical protein